MPKSQDKNPMTSAGVATRSFLSGLLGEARTNNLYAILATVGTLSILFKGCAMPLINEKIKEIATPVITPIVKVEASSATSPLRDELIALKTRMDLKDSSSSNLWARVRALDDRLTALEKIAEERRKSR